MNASTRTIFDFGANNGDDIDYYLKKADRVVAVEANPALVSGIRERFANEIEDGRLHVENVVLTTDVDEGEVPFFIHRDKHVLSRMVPPEARHAAEFDEVRLPCRSALAIVREHGEPYYIKIDLEGADGPVLAALLRAGIRPPYISAEAHHADVFAHLVSLGGYAAFNLVNGISVSTDYASAAIQTRSGVETYSFPAHSAGPFGEDINGPWLSAYDFLPRLATERLGWKDVHATSEIEPSSDASALSWGLLKAAATGVRKQISRSIRRVDS